MAIEVPLCPESEILDHAHDVHLHGDRFDNPVTFEGLKKLPVDIAYLLTLLIDIHPRLPVLSHLEIWTAVTSLVHFTLVKNPNAKKEEEGKGQDE